MAEILPQKPDIKKEPLGSFFMRAFLFFYFN